LDSGEPPGPQVQGSRLPRRRLQHAAAVHLGGAVLPCPRLRRHPLGEPRGLWEMGSG